MKKFWTLAALAAMLMSFFVPTSASAAPVEFTASATRSCDNVLVLGFDGPPVISAQMALTNTSDSWAPGWESIPTDGTVKPAGHNFDKVALLLTFVAGAEPVFVDLDVGECGETASNTVTVDVPGEEPSIPDGWELVTGRDMPMVFCYNGETVRTTNEQIARWGYEHGVDLLNVEGPDGQGYFPWPDYPEITRGECDNGEEPTPIVVTPVEPMLDGEGICGQAATVSLPSVDGVVYGETYLAGGMVIVTASAAEGYVFPDGVQYEWTLNVSPPDCSTPTPGPRPTEPGKAPRPTPTEVPATEIPSTPVDETPGVDETPAAPDTPAAPVVSEATSGDDGGNGDSTSGAVQSSAAVSGLPTAGSGTVSDGNASLLMLSLVGMVVSGYGAMRLRRSA